MSKNRFCPECFIELDVELEISAIDGTVEEHDAPNDEEDHKDCCNGQPLCGSGDSCEGAGKEPISEAEAWARKGPHEIKLDNMDRDDDMVALSIDCPDTEHARAFIALHQTIGGCSWKTANDLNGYVSTYVTDRRTLLEDLKKEEPGFEWNEDEYFAPEGHITMYPGDANGEPTSATPIGGRLLYGNDVITDVAVAKQQLLAEHQLEVPPAFVIVRYGSEKGG
jgi:hypothetical protein